MGSSSKVWRFLKTMTKATPQTIVKCVEDENGFEAWRMLCNHYEPQIHIRRGDILMDFAKLGASACKDVAATRVLMGEWDRMRKEVREITGKSVDNDHAIGALLSAIDKTPGCTRHRSRARGWRSSASPAWSSLTS